MKPLNIAKLDTLSLLLKTDLKTLTHICSQIDKFYVEESIGKKSGEKRILHKPRYTIKVIQSNIKRFLSVIPLPDCVHGWIKGKSVKSAIKPHLDMQYLYCFDIKSYFDSIRNTQVFKLFTRQLCCSPEVAKLLTRLSTYRYCLPQGSPCSPVIANLILFDFDTSMKNYARKRNAKYTRLGDDILLSSNSKLTDAFHVVVKGLQRNGLKINRNKFQLGMPKRSGVKVLGVVIGAGVTGVAISRKYRQEVKAILHNAQKTGLNLQNVDGRFDMRKHLAGRIAFIEMFDPVHGADLRIKLNTIKD